MRYSLNGIWWRLFIITSALVLNSSEGAGTAIGLEHGFFHTCVIRASDSSLVCFGDNEYNQLSYGFNVSSVGSTPAEPVAEYTVDLGGSKVSAVSCGGYNTCVLLDEGTVDAPVKCFGDNSLYQLGIGNNATATVDASTRKAVEFGTGIIPIATSVGSFHACVITNGPGKTTGSLYCWGDNTSGQLGRPANQMTTPGAIVGPLNFGTGRSGYGNTEDVAEASKAKDIFLGTGVYATTIEAGDANTCAILSNKKLLCWGSNDFGQLGIGSNVTTSGYDTPGNSTTVDLGIDAAVTSVSLGVQFVCAIVNIGTVKCWGFNRFGQLGQGTTDIILGDTAATTPAKIKPISIGNGTAIAVRAGVSHVCIIRVDDTTATATDSGDVICWGGNYDGQLGYGNTEVIGDKPTTPPTAAPTLEPTVVKATSKPTEVRTAQPRTAVSIRCTPQFETNMRLVESCST
eukprot:21240-Heterococcus_DN1.PRE.1